MGGITGNATALRVTVGILVLLAFVPLLHNGYYENLGRSVLMFATLSLGWNLIGGYTGYVSFGNVAFFGLGAYTSAALWQHWHQQSLLVAVLCAIVVGVVFAAVLGLPILRLRGHYFAIATLGMALALQEIVANIDWLGAGAGYAVRPLDAYSSYYVAMWIVCAGSMLATYLIARSKLGYAFVAIRENEEAAAVLGVDPTRYKVIAWAIGAAMAAAAGAVFAGANGFIDPPTAFATDSNVFPIVMALLGGVGTVAGPLIGAIILTAINESLWSRFPQIHTLFFGAVIVLVVVFLPRGLLWLLDTRGGWRAVAATLGAYRV
ncbi:MAG: branched-chain amino acid ABC transporter permease [Candidatus Lustribacter sp.]